MKIGLGELIHGDCIEVMKTLPDQSIDAVITDPPYFLSSQRVYKERKNIEDIKGDGSLRENIENNTGYGSLVRGFMGKKWDGFIDIYDYQNFSKKWATEALRVLKPGGFVFSFGGTRTYHRMACGIEDAGFIINNCIMWAYCSGFPKAQDVAIMIENKLGGEGEDTGIHNPNERPNCSKENTLYESGTVGKEVKIKKPTLPQSKEWVGWKTAQLKPAYEPIVVAQKPVEGTIAENILKHGVGGINVDACRIHINLGDEPVAGNRTATFGTQETISGGDGSGGWEHNNRGRFPPNLLSEDNVLDNGRTTQSAKIDGSTLPNTGKNGIYGIYGNIRGYDDSGSQNRYFDLDAWWEKQIKTLPKEAQKTFPFLFVPKASRSEKNEGLDGFEETPWRGTGNDAGKLAILDVVNNSPRPNNKNSHPTVKPTKIISYLITLSTKEGATVLDPFMGSGTTGVACEMLGRKWIGIEKEEEYFKIAEGRLNEFKGQMRL